MVPTKDGEGTLGGGSGLSFSWKQHRRRRKRRLFVACGERAGFLRGGERSLVEIADEISDIAKGDFL